MPDFAGFRAEDIKGNIQGTHWRVQLGGALVSRLQGRCGAAFLHVAISRVPEVYVVPAAHWRQVSLGTPRYRRGKLLVRTEDAGVHFGFYIEKGYAVPEAAKKTDEVLDPTWDWHRFVELLDGPDRRVALPDLLQALRLQLVFESEGGGVRTHLTAVRRPDGSFNVAENDTSSRQDWSYIRDKIVSAPADHWVNFYLERFLTRAEALTAGAGIVDQIEEFFCCLLPLLSSAAGMEPIECSNVNYGEKPMPRPTSHELAVHLEKRSGLRFTPYQIACYLTALQTKGFVILSGMSGTGKTKLAQAFAELLGADDGTNHLFLPVRPDWRDSKALIGYYNPILERYEATALLRFVLAARQAHETPRQASLADAVRAGLETPANKLWLTDLDSMLKGLAGKQADQLTPAELHTLWVPRDNGVSGIGQATSIRLPDDARVREATAIVMDMARTPGQRFVDAVKVLAPPNHWARVWRAIAACDIEHVHTIVHGEKVRELLGYLDFGSAQDPRDLAARNRPDEIDAGLRFIMDQVDRQLPGLGRLERAIAPWLMWEYFEGVASAAAPERKPAGDGVAPFFLLLDEMNLAHVEHYFADFLSVLESGRRENGFTLEEIRLHAFDTPVTDGVGGTIPPALALPPNLYIIGTVNVDETTHAFSPKVLDRAFTIEFEGADLAAYPPDQVDASVTLPDDGRSALLTAFTREGRFIQNAKAQDIAGAPARDSDFMAQLRDLEQLLRPYELHFAYRVVDDILAYLANAEKYGWFDELGGLDAALDSAVLMKVLPKFHGPRSRLKEPLHSILEWTGMPDRPEATASAPDNQGAIDRVRSILVNGPDSAFRRPQTALKCLRMLYQLAVTGFASFS